MPPLPPQTFPLPRLITYYQTHHDAVGKHVSLLPLLTQPNISMTHVMLAAIHINDDPAQLTLNDHPPSHERFRPLWAELRILQASGIKVMGMLGGAAKGSYERMDGSEEKFERYYRPLRDLVRERNLNGLDLDVEEEMSLAGIVRLIDRLRADFGPSFIISMAPVAMALLDPTKNLSGFDYEALEVMRGREIAFYNVQFYCGWGDLSNTLMYDFMLQKGWPAEKLVVGVVTNPANGSGFVPWDMLSSILAILTRRHKVFGGVMGWEYFNSLPGDAEKPWEWATNMSSILRVHSLPDAPFPMPPTIPNVPPQQQKPLPPISQDVDPDRPDKPSVEVPDTFEYFSDSTE